MSPDARYLAMIVVAGGREIVAVRDLVQHTPLRGVLAAAAKDEFYPQWCGWANPTRLLCSYRGLAADGGKFFPVTRLVAVNADGSDPEVLANNTAAWSQLGDEVIDWTIDDPRTVLIQLDQAEVGLVGATPGADVAGGGPDGYPDVYALDVYNGHKHLVARQRAPIQDFTTDGHGQVRLGYGYRDTKALFFARLEGERGWKELARVEAYAAEDVFRPIAAIAGSNAAYARRNYQGRDALWKIDLDDAADPQLVFAHPEVDLDSALFTDDHRLLGFSFETDRPGVYYTDRDAARAYDAVRRALPGKTNRIVDMTPDAKAFLVWSESDVAAPVYYVLDLHGAQARLEAVAASAPGLADHQLAPMQPVNFPSRDGKTRIPAYLTLPAQRPASGKPPLVVLPHGGPYARDSWGYDEWVQLLASRGYAVLQVEFRGSTGYGTDWFRAGFRDWGGLPYEDVIDGTRWAIAQGQVDAARTCVVGASYGGYMALLAATRNEGLFKCAVSIAGVSDLFELRNDERFFRNWEIANAGLAQDTKKLREDSPRQHAAGVNIPILLVHGERDYTVEVDHTKMMDAALRRAGKPHQTLIIEKTDHYFREDVPRRALYTTLVRFLGEQLGTPPAPAAAPAATPAQGQ
ncbi:MAG: S9 family peptidase [Steroidobacteraceae bacterium]